MKHGNIKSLDDPQCSLPMFRQISSSAAGCMMYRLATKRTVKTSGRKREREIFQT